MIKVLHIIENFNGQAIEKWLHQVLRITAGAESNIKLSFYSILGKPGKFDDDVRNLGAEIIYSPYQMRQHVPFVRSLRVAMIAGQYDVLHCHHDVQSAIYLLASVGLPFKKKIVHIHNTSLTLPTPNRLKIAFMHTPMRQVCLHYADQIIGISQVALEAFLGGRKPRLGRDKVIHCGIDTQPFRHKSLCPKEFRASLELTENARILLFVGRMIEYKNPCFVVEVLEYLSRTDSEVAAVFAGTGPLEDEVRKLAEQKHIGKRVKVLGWCNEIQKLMMHSDVLVWPGLEYPKEGLGLGVVEAQAAGLPVLMSRSVPNEAIVVPELVKVQPLAAGASIWAETIKRMLEHPLPNKQESLIKVESSSFSITNSMLNILELYR